MKDRSDSINKFKEKQQDVIFLFTLNCYAVKTNDENDQWINYEIMKQFKNTIT